MKVSITKYEINDFGEIVKGTKVETTFEDIDVNNFEELYYFYKLIYPKRNVHVTYENGERKISMMESSKRVYIRQI